MGGGGGGREERERKKKNKKGQKSTSPFKVLRGFKRITRELGNVGIVWDTGKEGRKARREGERGGGGRYKTEEHLCGVEVERAGKEGVKTAQFEKAGRKRGRQKGCILLR